MKSYTTISLFEKIYFTIVLRQKVFKPLDYIVYDKQKAKDFLNSEFSWQDYGVKHGESVFTRFFQHYWLPERYGFDKRKAHLSSVIVSGFTSRVEALEQLQEGLYDSKQLKLDKEYICNKLEIDDSELDSFLQLPKVDHSEYPSIDSTFNFFMRMYYSMRKK